MLLGDIDYSLELPKIKLFVCKPDRTIVGILKEAYGVKRNIKLGNVSELSFNLPYQLMIRGNLKDNPNIDKTKNRFLIKLVQTINGVTSEEWYVIKTPSDIMDDSADYKSIQAYGLPFELADKNIRGYSVISKTASQVLQDALNETLWTIGSVDSSFDILYRSFDVTNSNVLDFIFQIATTFNALVDFDTKNRRVNFKVFENFGTNKGLTAKLGNILKSANRVENTDEFYTRFKVFGKDGISIQDQNTTGQNFIEDYSYFIYPFSRDANKNVLTHSDYMSDSLCHALLDYQALLTSSKTTFQTYLTQLTGYQTTLTSQQNVLKTYQNDLALIEDQIANANYLGQSTAILITQKNNKQAQIDSQNVLITTTQTSITTVNTNIATLQNTLSVSSNFTTQQIQEWNPYIIVGTFENTNVSDSKQLLDLATAEFNKLKQPKIVININIVNFLECISEQKKWHMLNLGDTITIKNTKVGIDIQAKIIEIDFDYESGDINLVISNVKELLSDKEQFLKDLYRANTTSGIVSSNDWKWNDAASDVNDVNAILNNTWDATSRSIAASVDNTVQISRKGVIVSDPTDPNQILILQKGLLAISGDGGNNWNTVMNSSGVYGQRIIGQIIAGTNLTITNSAGNFLVNQNGVTISDLNLTVTNTTVKNKILISPSDGFKIQKNTGTTGSPVWTDQISLDTNGDAIFAGKVSIGSGNSIFTANTSGIALGNSTWSSAPFRVDLNGNVVANSLTANSATINNSNFNNGAIVGSSISINGNFTVTSSGYATMTGANVSGNINAYSGTLGTLTVTGTLTGGYINGTNITGSTISTRVNGSSGIVINSGYADTTWYSGSNTLFKVYDGLDHVQLYSGLSNGVVCTGAWNFSGATVTGITAKFA